MGIHSRTFLTCCVLNSPTVRQDVRSAMMKLVLLLSLALVATTVNARFLSQQVKRDIKGMLAKLETVVEKKIEQVAEQAFAKKSVNEEEEEEKRELADLWNKAAGEEEKEEEKRELADLLNKAASEEEEEEEKRELADLWNKAAGEEEEEEEKRELAAKLLKKAFSQTTDP